MLSKHVNNYVQELQNYLSERKERKFYNPFDFERVEFVTSLINLLQDDDLTYQQRANRAIKMINTVLLIPDKFSGQVLRPLLVDLNKCLIDDLHPHLYFFPETRKKNYDWANYKNMNSIEMLTTIQAGDYYCHRTLQNWISISLNHTAMAKSRYNVIDDELGWKLHIAFDHTNLLNVEKGMDVVLKHLVSNNVASFKIIPNNKKITPLTEGKDVTIYISDDRPVSEWQKLMTKIEMSLIAEAVTPGKQPLHTMQINGSQFISYRNDKDKNGNYVQNQFNAANEADHLKDITININASARYFRNI